MYSWLTTEYFHDDDICIIVLLDLILLESLFHNRMSSGGGLLNFFYPCLQYPDYIDAYLRLAAIAKAQNNILLSIELVSVIPLTSFHFLLIN